MDLLGGSSSSGERAPGLQEFHKWRWVWYFLFILIFLIGWGVVQTEFFPLFSSQVKGFSLVDMNQIAPGSSDTLKLILRPWVRWDTLWYLGVAREGYKFNLNAVAYPPLFPFLIQTIGTLLGRQYLIVSLLISWASLFGACALIADRARKELGIEKADMVILKMLLFPTAYFFFAGYTESLFLFLVLLSWRMAEDKVWWLVCWGLWRY